MLAPEADVRRREEGLYKGGWENVGSELTWGPGLTVPVEVGRDPRWRKGAHSCSGLRGQ